MAKSIKLKDNTYIDSTGVSHNRDTLKNVLDNLNNLLTPVTLFNNGYITPASGVVNIGNISNYKRLLIILHANDSYTSVEIPRECLDQYFGVNWQAMDNRLANYYVTFKIASNGDVSILYSGYNRVDLNYDNERNYGISAIYGYKY